MLTESASWTGDDVGVFSALLIALAGGWAASRMVRVHPDPFGCLVLGDSPNVAAAAAEARERGLADRLHFAGDVPHELCLALIAHGDGKTPNTALTGPEAIELYLKNEEETAVRLRERAA